MYDDSNCPLYAFLYKSYLSKMPNAIWRRGGYISNVMRTPKKRQISSKKKKSPSLAKAGYWVVSGRGWSQLFLESHHRTTLIIMMSTTPKKMTTPQMIERLLFRLSRDSHDALEG